MGRRNRRVDGHGRAPGTGGAPPAQSSVVTSASGTYWKSGTLTTVTSGNATVTVTDSSTAQTWEGFGGAFNELGWSYLSMLSQSDRDNALQLLYGANGAHFNIGRVPIGANDYAISRYTDDEVASGSTDYNMTSFSLTEDTKYLIPYIKAAQAVNGSIRFWGSPWTPPTWMKTSSGSVNGTACTFSGTAFDSGCMMDNAQVLTAYAQYFIKWVQGYAAQGITIESIGPQNEPNYFDNYPSCGWTPALFTKFVGQYLGPAFTAANLTTKIMLGTMSNADSGKDPSIVSAVLADSTAKSYIKLFGYQWNMHAQRRQRQIQQSAHLADRAQMRQLPLEPVGLSRLQRQHGAQRLRLRRGELGKHPRLDRGGRDRLQRLEHGARHGGQEHRLGAPLAAERAHDGRTPRRRR